MKEYLPEDFVNFLTGGVFAMIGGMLSYLLKVYEGKVFQWGEFLLHAAISGFTGLIAFRILLYIGTPTDLVGVLCGLAGWMGTRALKLFEYMLKQKFTPNDSTGDEE